MNRTARGLRTSPAYRGPLYNVRLQNRVLLQPWTRSFSVIKAIHVPTIDYTKGCTVRDFPILYGHHHARLPRRSMGYPIVLRRHLSVSGLLLIPAVYGGLAIVLWTWKSCLMILAQNHIIYMPNLPPNSRQETISNYPPITWEEETLTSADGMKVKLLKGAHPNQRPAKKNCVILYFQGNASSLPPRLQYLSQTLKLIVDQGARLEEPVLFSLAALSYRGYWTSRGRRPTERGIKLDAQAALKWVYENYDRDNTTLIIWGQSIGSGVATTALAKLLEDGFRGRVHLLLETPFTHLKDMLAAIYPQKFLPYRYLWPFLRSHWDSVEAFRTIGTLQRKEMPPKVLIVQAENDEIVPSKITDDLEGMGKEAGLSITRKIIKRALHQDAMMRTEGRQTVTNFVLDAASERNPKA